MNERPFVFINMAVSIDGKISSYKHEKPSFTSRTDRHRMDNLRAQSDAVLIGAGTLRAEDPPLHIRDPKLAKPLLQIVMTRLGNVDVNAKFFQHPCIVATSDDVELSLPPTAEIWHLGKDQVDVHELLRRLQQRGVRKLLIEGGGNVAWDFFKHHVVDEIYVTIAPALFGGKAPSFLGGDGFDMQHFIRLQLLSVEPIASELFCHYKVLGAA
jgi:2,5-diamino-6-(ribosylamino)-4(3H)-pyrimidinone 5'-phosphate reductase